MKNKKQKLLDGLLHPVRVFIAILLVAIIYFAPIAFPPNVEE